MTELTWVANARGEVVYLNGEWRRVDVTLAHFRGNRWRATIHPADLERVLALWAEALEHGTPYRSVHRTRFGHGVYRRYVTDAFPLRDREGRIAFWCGVKHELDGWDLDIAIPSAAGEGPGAARQSALARLSHPYVIDHVADRPHVASSCHLHGGTAPVQDDAEFDVDIRLGVGITKLLTALPQAQVTSSATTQFYARSLCLAVLAQLADGRVLDGTAPTRRPTSSLPKWRLGRVVKYVTDNLSEPLRLSQLAQAAGLTRMHFAAQFRAATGMSPHEYLLRARIKHAQTMLRDPEARLVDVALAVGFQTQSHFTTTFKRYVGETPNCWRLRVAGDRGHQMPDHGDSARRETG
jgi:AraC-like DNA-binding protein